MKSLWKMRLIKLNYAYDTDRSLFKSFKDSKYF